MPAQSGRDQWRVMGFPATVTNLQTGAQTTGTIIVATDVTTVYNTIQRLIWVDVIVSAMIVCVLAIVGSRWCRQTCSRWSTSRRPRERSRLGT